MPDDLILFYERYIYAQERQIAELREYLELATRGLEEAVVLIDEQRKFKDVWAQGS